MKKYNFDNVLERRGTNSEKWDRLHERFGAGSDVLLPMWVADMDFSALPDAVDAMRERLEHAIFGYTFRSESWKESVINWIGKRHRWSINPEWIEFSPGVVPAISTAVLSCTEEGDGVLIQPPVYPPFARTIKGLGRKVVENRLMFDGKKFSIDFDDLERKLPSVKLFLLCSPHNPCGRVWTRDELLRLTDVCCRHNVVIFSDEIHADIVYSGNIHIPTAAVSPEAAAITITAMSPSKTFNLAGLATSEIVIPDSGLRAKFAFTLDALHIGGGNIFGAVAAEAVYRNGEQWLNELLEYLDGNVNFMAEFFERKVPKLKLVYPQGTYVPFVDCRELKLSESELEELFYRKIKVAANAGHTFGPGGEGFMRINIGTSRKILEEGLNRIKEQMT